MTEITAADARRTGPSVVSGIDGARTIDCIPNNDLVIAWRCGPSGLRRHQELHVRNTQCKHCEVRLLGAVIDDGVPERIAQNVNSYPDYGAFGSALRQYLASLKENSAQSHFDAYNDQHKLGDDVLEGTGQYEKFNEI
jgi:hypothetical protein